MDDEGNQYLLMNNITGTGFWRKSINKEMSKVKITWKVDGGYTPSEAKAETANMFVRFQEIGCYFIFDVKIDFTRKSRFVSGGHTIEAP